MDEREEQLHHLDLAQIDRVQKLVARLQNDLTRWGGMINTEALLDTNALEARTLTDASLAKMAKENENGNGKVLTVDGVMVAIAQSKDQAHQDKVRILTSMKDAVWSCSNALRSAHEKRKGLLATESKVLPNTLTQEEIEKITAEADGELEVV